MPIVNDCPKCGKRLSRPGQSICPACALRQAALLDESEGEIALVELPRRIGDYEIEEEIARGGMGVVYRARQLRLNRKVALKIITGGAFASVESLRRFRIEAEIAASLDHPHIVPIFEIGEHDLHSYFSMGLVEGPTLASRMADGGLKTRQAVELIVKICAAVHFAHDRGVLHRDIKPTNILLDREGEPHLTDFGLAKLIAVESTLTHTNAVMGTPSYMAPEQARGDSKLLSVATDVYGLGAVLYHTLTGVPPFAGGTSLETVRLLLEKEPKKPSVFNGEVDRDLDVICLKALAKEPAARYRSAAELGEDLKRWLRHEPIQARPASAAERALKLVRRHPIASAFSVAALVLAIFGTGAIFTQWQRAEKARRIADEQRDIAREQTTIARERLYAADIPLAEASIREGNLGRAMTLLEAHRPEAGQPDLRGFEWRYLWARCQGQTEWRAAGPFGNVTGLAFSPDAKTLAAVGDNQRVCRIWNLAAKTSTTIPGSYRRVAFSPDGRSIALIAREGSICLVDSRTLRLRWKTDFPGAEKIAFSPDSRLVAVACTQRAENGEAALLDTDTGEILHAFPDTTSSCVAFSPDGVLVATADVIEGPYRTAEDPTARIKVWKVSTAQLVFSTPVKWVPTALAFSRDGKELACAHGEGFIDVVGVASGNALASFRGHESVVTAMGYFGSAGNIVTAATDHKVKVFSGTREPIEDFSGHLSSVTALDVSADGRLAASGSVDRILIHSLAGAGQKSERLVPALAVQGLPTVVWSDSGSSFATVTSEGVAIWNAASGGIIAQNRTLRSTPISFLSEDVLFSVQELRWKSIGDLLLETWNLKTREVKTFSGNWNGCTALALSADKTTLSIALMSGEVILWDRISEKAKTSFNPHGGAISALGFSPDGKYLASGGVDSTVKLWELPDLRRAAEFEGHFSAVLGFAFAHQTNLLATVSEDHTVKLWKYPEGRMVASLNGHKERVVSVSFSPDDQTLATGGGDSTGAGKLWNVRTAREILTIPGGCWDIRFSPDSRWLATADRNRNLVQLWHAPTFEEIDEETKDWAAPE